MSNVEYITFKGGQMKITIPSSNKPWFYIVKLSDEGQSLESFKARFCFDEGEFEFLNPNLTSLRAGDLLIIPPSPQYFHIAAPLETYQTIANMFNTSTEELISKNKTQTTFVGQKIYI